jgi:hypothetical protein
MMFYAVERWRWRNTWEDYSQQARKRGVKLEIAEFPRPDVPDAKNFGRIPFFESSYQNPQPPDGLSGPIFNLILGSGIEWGWARSHGVSPSEAAHSAVAAPRMQQLLTGAKPGESTGSDNARVNWTPDIAKMFLARLDEECGDVSRQLREGADRPLCKFPADGYDDDDRTPKKPPFLRLRKSAQLEAIRVGLHAAARDGVAALDDLRICMRITDATKSEPYLVAAMIRTALAALTTECIWTGLSEQVWDDRQLAILDQWLAETDLIATYQFGIATERIYFNKIYKGFASDSLKGLYAEEKNWGKRTALRFFPTGWVYRNQIKINQYCDAAVVKADPFQRTLSCDFAFEERQIESANKIQDFLFLITAPGFTRAALRTAATEALVRQARVACALERHRLKYGGYPEKLDELITAKLLPALPRDPINNELMDYQRTIDGRYALKSIETARATKDVAPWPAAWIPGR